MLLLWLSDVHCRELLLG
uniref:Uncharacterized protein n=1 Tax=Anguilla anguilla TaxID=7936 RepID=A0A0E9SVB3_ANGAN